MPIATLWKEEKISVYFMNKKAGVRYENAELEAWNVMDIVRKGWNFDEDDFKKEHSRHVPRFERVNDQSKAHVRVQFKCKPSSRS